VLCAIAIVIYLLIDRRNPLPLLRQSWAWRTLAIALAIGAIWYVPALIFGRDRFVKIVLAENFGHFMPVKLGGTGESHRPFYFIAARLLGGSLPMALLMVPAVLAFAASEIPPDKRRPMIYQISMTLAVLLFFSIASVKRDDYILPAIPGIAILSGTAIALPRNRETSLAARVALWISTIFPIACASAMLIGFVVARSRPDLPLGASLQSSDAAFAGIFGQGLATLQFPYVACAVGLLCAAGVAVWAFRRRDPVSAAFAFALTGLAGSLLWTATLRPALASMRSLKGFAPQIATLVKGAPLCIPSNLNYELSFYYGAAVPPMHSARCPDAAPGHSVYVVATPRELEALTPRERAGLKLIVKSELIGGGGPPALYELEPHHDVLDLKRGSGAAR
jgi:hypothetical protein